MFSKDIKIETTSETEYGTLTGIDTIGNWKENMKIEGDKTIFTADREYIINYIIEDNVCKFELSRDFQIDEDSTEEDMNYMGTALYRTFRFDTFFLAVADALGIDLSLAYTYYSQNTDESIDVENDLDIIFSVVENDIFSVKVLSEKKSSETFTSTVSLEVNLLEMSKLDASKIDQSSYSTVTLVEPNEEDQIEDEKELPVDEGNEEEKEPQVKEDSEEEKKTPVNEDVKIDDTLANNDIPKAGIENVINIIGIILIVVCVLYLKNKKYRDIK